MVDTAPSCFGEFGLQVPEMPIGKGATQNLVTCIYQTKLAGLCRHVAVTWVRNVMGQGLCIVIDDPSCQYTCKVQMKPWYFWRKQGSKCFEVCGSKVEVLWDLSSAKYVCGPEPQEGFYVAVVSNEEVVLLLGDKCREAYKKSKARPSAIEASLFSRKEHVFGKKYFCTKAQFDESGKAHDIAIECETNAPKEPFLCIKIDRQMVLHVKRLAWKFRGNQTVCLGGFAIEVFWDVHNWLFDSGSGNAVFIFQTCIAPEKSFSSKGSAVPVALKWSGDLNGSISVMKLSRARSVRSVRELSGFTGFSLMLHAWKNE